MRETFVFNDNESNELKNLASAMSTDKTSIIRMAFNNFVEKAKTELLTDEEKSFFEYLQNKDKEKAK